MHVLRNGGAFRDPSEALEHHASLLRKQHIAELETLAPELLPLLARRFARIRAGQAAILLMGAVFVVSVVAALAGGGWMLSSVSAHHLAGLLFVSWLAIPAIYLFFRFTTAERERTKLLSQLRCTGDVGEDLRRLRSTSSRTALLSAIDGLEARSLALPLAGVAMTLPLFFHFMIYTVATGLSANLLDFGAWVALSGIVVGHCHLVVAYQGYRYGNQLAAEQTRDDSGIAAVGIAMAVSTFPGLLLLGIPTVLVGLTGAVIIPAMFWDARRILRTERALLSRF